MAPINSQLPGIEDIAEKLPGYRIETQLGSASMGVVFLAEELSLGRKVALKVLSPSLADDDRFRRRFSRESQMAANLDHPHVVPIYRAGEAGGLLYIAMRYVDGPDLQTLIEVEGPFTLQRATAIIDQVAAALDAAHEEGLVHRDVKPANILVDRGSGDHCYLCDFGVTKQISSGEGLTVTGQFVGTIDYTAPEQIQGKPVDGRADVYALGCVLYQCLTGQVPFPREQSVAVLSAHLYDEPPSVTTLRPDLPPMIDRVVAKAMAKQPERRYRTCGELAQALRAIPASVHDGATVIRDGLGDEPPPEPSIDPTSGAAGGGSPPPSWQQVAGAPPLPPWQPVGTPDNATVRADGPPKESQVGIGKTSGRSPQRWPMVAAVVGLALMALIVIVTVVTFRSFPTPEEQVLLTHVPTPSRINCERAPDIGDFPGATVGVRCGPTSGVQTASYYQFRDLASLQSAYNQRAREAGAPQAPCKDLPANFLGEGKYVVGNLEAGRLLCRRSLEDRPVIEWTDERLLILVQAVGIGSDPKTLIDWWNTEGSGPIPLPTATLTPDELALVATIPANSRIHCAHAPDVSSFPGATVGVQCEPTSGAREVRYYRFQDLGSMQAAYEQKARHYGAYSTGSICDQLPHPFLAEHEYARGHARVGRLFCATVDGKPFVGWTHEQRLILALAKGDDPNALVGWWGTQAGPI